MPEPRIVGVGYKIQYKSYLGRVVASEIEWRTSDLIPSSLHTCAESREEALKVYDRSFGRYREQGRNYIDFDHDTLYFGGSGRGFSNLDALVQSTYDRPGNYLLDMFLGADSGVRDAEKIQRMILDVDDDRYGRRLFIWDEIRLFTGLRELTLLAWEDDLEADRLMLLYRQTLQAVAGKHPEWVVPKITVIATYTKTVWGTLNAETPRGS